MIWRVVGLILAAVAVTTIAVTVVLPHAGRPAPVRMWPMTAADRQMLHAAEMNICQLRRAGQPDRVILGLLPAGDHPDAAAVIGYAETHYCPAYLPGGKR